MPQTGSVAIAADGCAGGPSCRDISLTTRPAVVGGIRYEHTHRLIASTVGFLTIILALWTWRVEPRAWVRRLAFAALGAVILQGMLGGLTVLLLLPPAVSIGHAALAQLFFCITITLAVVTSPSWNALSPPAE